MSRRTDAGVVVAVCRSATHSMRKDACDAIRIVEGLGVEGDAHAGRTVQHRVRVARDPSAPNLRQVHVIHEELHDELRAAGFQVTPGVMGENVLTRGIDLLALPTGALLHLGESAVLRVSGLRNPCTQLDQVQPGLMSAVLDRDADGALVRKAGVMCVVVVGGDVRPGDRVGIALPETPHEALRPV
jgi:MOSC domain-containing protein YiiM